MEISDDIERALTYGLNARLLAALPGLPTGAELAASLLRILEVEGPRFHEPTLLTDWTTEVGLDDEELGELLEETLDTILLDLADDEEPFSAHKVLALLADEPFWVFRFGLSGGTAPAPPLPGTGLPLPLELRPGVVAVLDQLELTLHEARLDLRSVHDRLDDRFVREWVRAAVQAIADLGRAHRLPELPELLRLGPPTARPRLGEPRLRPPLTRALETIQRWKLSVEFDASPDDDDGEWTLRVLEQLYDLSWSPTDPAPGAG